MTLASTFRIIVVAASCFGCSKRATSDAAESATAVADASIRAPAPSSPPATPSASASNAGSPVDASVDSLGFQIVRNIEMVPYCLPYPSMVVREDLSERWEHGRKVFTARTTPPGAKPARIDLAAVCGQRGLRELYEEDRKNIVTEVGAAAITVSTLHSDSYALSWRQGDRIHYGKMWAARGDATCFVRATFDYDVRERAAFDVIVTRVTATDPTCPD